MREFINLIVRKVSSLIGTFPLRKISDNVSQIKDVSGNILIHDFLRDNLFAKEVYTKSKKITHFHRSVFAQNGEDGIIEEIFNRIGITNRFFVEFGVHGIKNNSTFLLVKGWNGLWIGASKEGHKLIAKQFKQVLDMGKLRLEKTWITKDNIEQILSDYSVPKELDFLSIDLDGNDYWIWQAIKDFSPRVVCIEYNATFPSNVSWIMSYNAHHQWNQTSYFGASLKALEHLGKSKGYELIGCDFTGCNAFFVRNDQSLDKFERPFTAEHHYEPARYYLQYSNGHEQGFGPFSRQI